MSDTQLLLTLAALFSFIGSLVTLAHMFRAEKHAALWHVSLQTFHQHQRRFTLRTIALSAIGFIVALVALVPALTPGYISYNMGFLLQWGGIALIILIGLFVITTYRR